jgi:hypothetical protein
MFGQRRSETGRRYTYKNNRVITWRLSKDNISALDAVHDGLSLDVDFGQKFENHLKSSVSRQMLQLCGEPYCLINLVVFNQQHLVAFPTNTSFQFLKHQFLRDNDLLCCILIAICA